MTEGRPAYEDAVATGLLARGNDLYRVAIEHAAEMDDVSTDDAAELAAAIEGTYARRSDAGAAGQCGWKPTPKAEEG